MITNEKELVKSNGEEFIWMDSSMSLRSAWPFLCPERGEGNERLAWLLCANSFDHWITKRNLTERWHYSLKHATIRTNSNDIEMKRCASLNCFNIHKGFFLFPSEFGTIYTQLVLFRYEMVLNRSDSEMSHQRTKKAKREHLAINLFFFPK